MNKIALILLAAWMAASGCSERPITWPANLSEAVDQAKKENKLLLLDFTGSDWCGWCQKLDGEVFSRPEFIDYASKNLVLVQVDFPMHKPQADDLKKTNHDLKEKYAVNGFPTVLVIKPDGTVLWEQRGYAPGGPGAMIDAVNRCKQTAGIAEQPKPAAPVAAVPIRQPAPPPQGPGDEPKLQGLFYSAAHSSVVLDGKLCGEGETVHDMRVIKIARDNVTVEYQGQIKVLKMN